MELQSSITMFYNAQRTACITLHHAPAYRIYNPPYKGDGGVKDPTMTWKFVS